VQWRKAEILIRVIASGIHRTDVAMSLVPSEALGFAPYPKVLGHEGSGIVERARATIKHVKAGDMVLLSFDYCGEDTCRGCSDEALGYCGQFYPRNLLIFPKIHQDEDGTATAGLFFGQSSFSHLALVKGTSALNVTGLVRDEEELRLFLPIRCGFQTGAASITELANIGEHDAIAVGTSDQSGLGNANTDR
jgi:Zn-dependent alcohol dehydrogenase